LFSHEMRDAPLDDNPALSTMNIIINYYVCLSRKMFLYKSK
jgi:hypothetical protein